MKWCKMQQTHTEHVQKILQNKNRLETALKVKITNKGKLVFVNGKPEKEYIALRVIEAVNLGFSVERALFLKDEKVILQTLHIKDITKKHNLENIRARIIGTQGRTLKTLNKLTDCAISLKDNQVGIIGNAEEIEYAVQALTSLIQGSKQGHVYGRVERERKVERLRGKGLE